MISSEPAVTIVMRDSVASSVGGGIRRGYHPDLDAMVPDESNLPLLPCEQDSVSVDFPDAGLFIRGTRHYFAVLGTSNGGVLKIFDRNERAMVWNDAGYVGQDLKGRWLTTQMTVLDRPTTVKKNYVAVEAPFYIIRREFPGPWRFLLLRLLNLTVMRSITLGNWMKVFLANLLIVGKKQLPLRLKRTVAFLPEAVQIRDVVQANGPLKLDWLSYGKPFVSIHMASAKYFENEHPASLDGEQVPVEHLNEENIFEMQVTI